MIKRFFANQESAGIILIISAILAMLLANINTTKHFYTSLLAMPVEFRFGDLHINKNMLLWINDALMTLFFLSVSLKIKREMVLGTLASRERAIFPLIAALGGMLMPGLIFLLFNGSDEEVRSGWAIPTATDIAFALSVLSLLGKRVPLALKIFLMTLAMIDDLGAIVIITVFYTGKLSLFYLLVAGIATIILIILNYFKVYRVSSYMIIGIVLWIAILKSGIHATLAGVIIGLFIPLIPLANKDETSPAMILENALHPWVNWFILPLFAFANSGIILSDISLNNLFSLMPVSIMLSLFIGKPLGITLFCWLGIRCGIAMLPKNSSLSDIAAVSVLCGIGFTMSIFIASLAYEPNTKLILLILAKLGILIGSLISALSGWLLLRSRLS